MIKVKFNSEKEWLAERKKYIGASDASIIMGASRWKLPDGRIKTPNLLYQEKLGFLNLSCDNPATRYGKVMEEPAREVYQEMVGDLFEPICVKNKKYPYLMVSLDGLNVTDNKMVEIKNVNREDHELAKQGIVPDKYIPQVQAQIMGADLPTNDYFSFYKGEGVIVKVKRDDDYIKLLDEKLKEFWGCVENLKEPPLTDDDYIVQGLQWQAYARQLHQIKKQKRELCLKEKKVEKGLKELSDGKNSCSGAYRYTHSISLGRVNYKAIPELLNVNLDSFRSEPISTWRLRKGPE